MPNNKFPNGVGKKIVDALKQQDDIETFDGMPEETINIQQDDLTMSFDNTDTMSADAFQITDEEQPAFISNLSAQQPLDDNFDDFKMPQFADDFPQPQPQQFAQPQPVNVNASQGQNMPTNVTVLKRLISQLPNGVTRQTGAQIIRQTMEALGISMNSVLHEAQQVQDSLNGSVKECMMTVQEYKNNIKILEKQIMDYQKQASQLNELISLFVLTDKKNNL